MKYHKWAIHDMCVLEYDVKRRKITKKSKNKKRKRKKQENVRKRAKKKIQDMNTL